MAFCRVVPDATVVGLDPWPPALELARSNVGEAGLESRVTLVETTIQDFEDTEGFDLAWLPSFFVLEAVLDDAVRRVRELLRPGGRIVVGARYADESDPIAWATDDLMTVRSGGSVLDPAGAIEELEANAFEDVHEVARTWNPPLRFVVGTRA
jgi:SAM-dependent methyltransferase